MDLFSQLAAVFGVLSLLGGALWWLRKRGLVSGVAPRKARRMQCIERLPLGPQHTLQLVRVGQSVLLLACSTGRCSLIQSYTSRDIEEIR
jgi:flagellar biosynthetic protein FliO